MAIKCYSCKHRRTIPCNAHIRCAKPDPDMEGNPHGVNNGWFNYPVCFDPIWIDKECVNFEAKEKV